MEILLLGSGGWIPTAERETCCAYIRRGSRVLLLDAGTGVQRLVEEPELLYGVDALDIVLTHFHLDHVVGLSYLPALQLPGPPTLWGPGRRLGEGRSVDLLERLLAPPLFAVPLAELAAVRELPEGGLSLGPFELTTRVQERHSSPTLALRVGDELTYCTDTALDRENASFAAGSRVLFHEAWYPGAATDDPTHSAAGEAGAVAREAGVDRLVLIHLSPLLRSVEELEASARAEFPAASAGRDLVPVELSGRGT